MAGTEHSKIGIVERAWSGPGLLGPLALLLVACGDQPEFASLLPEPEQPAYVQPAAYPDPEAPTADAAYGADYGGTQYDGNDEIVNGKCNRYSQYDESTMYRNTGLGRSR